MRLKKGLYIFSVSAMLWLMFACGLPTQALGVVHAGEAEEVKPPAVPQNLRFEDGFIVWDEAENAYGYALRTYVEDNEREYTYYVTSVELDRFCCENEMDFGEYRFEVCAFDESGNRSEWSSEPINAVYAPALELDVPANVRLSEDGIKILWDQVDGAVRYNIRYYKEGDERDQRRNYTSDCDIFVKNHLGDNGGNYYFLIQAMDKDYNVSQWSEPVLVSQIGQVRLDAPTNLRLDESGENILWDEVEGADYYNVSICALINIDEETRYYVSDRRTHHTEQPMYSNWKSQAAPFSDGEYEITVSAWRNGGTSADNSYIMVSFQPERDESIVLPENIRVENGRLKWDNVEGADKYWLCISVNGELLRGEWECVDAEQNEGIYISNKFPNGTYEVGLFVVDEKHNYNGKTYTLTIDTVHDETIWIPELFYKFDALLWDYDRVRHDKTAFFWIRFTKDGSIVKLANVQHDRFDGLPKLANGDYIVEACACEYSDAYNVGEWSKPLEITKHDGGLFDKENESIEDIIPPPEAEKIPEEDRIKSITINPAFNMKHKDGNDVELDLTKIKVKAEEIYDEEGLKRAEEALGETLKGNKHYNLLDMTLLYDGKDFSNGYEGLVQVIIPIPKGHRDKTYSCYRLTEVNGKLVKEMIPGEQTEDSYIIYLEHFSEYALVGEGEHVHSYEETWKTDGNSHWKECECGEKAQAGGHTYGEWKITKEATETEAGLRERSCTVCGYKTEEAIPVKPHVHVYGEEWKTDGNSHWKECECGGKTQEGSHAYGEWKITKEATETEEGSKERSCTVCGYKQTENLPKLTPSAPPVDEKKPVEFKDSSTKIQITAPADAFDQAGDITFHVVSAADQTKDNAYAYDLIFKDKAGNKVQPKTKVIVKIPVPEALKDRTVFVYHVEDNGIYTEIDGRSENGMAVFTASRFSIYVIAGEKLNAEGNVDETDESDVSDETDISPAPGAYVKSPNTNDYPAAGIAVLSILAAALMISATGFYKKIK